MILAQDKRNPSVKKGAKGKDLYKDLLLLIQANATKIDAINQA
jgi:hypothetical protein